MTSDVGHVGFPGTLDLLPKVSKRKVFFSGIILTSSNLWEYLFPEMVITSPRDAHKLHFEVDMCIMHSVLHAVQSTALKKKTFYEAIVTGHYLLFFPLSCLLST